jgi:hypothetical protein
VQSAAIVLSAAEDMRSLIVYVEEPMIHLDIQYGLCAAAALHILQLPCTFKEHVGDWSEVWPQDADAAANSHASCVGI